MTVIDLGVPSLGPTAPAPADGPLVDTFGRVATDLRVSLTDRCNLRCTYCMPAEGLDWLPGEQLLAPAELTRLLRIAVTRLGITSVRFTGGEPLVAKHLEDVVAATAVAAAAARNRVDHQRNWPCQAGGEAEARRAGPHQRVAGHRRRRALHPHHPPRPAARCARRPAGRQGRRAGAGEGERRARSGHRSRRRRRPAAVLPRPRIPAAHHRTDAARRRPRVAARQGHRRRRRARRAAPAFRSDARLGASRFGARGTVARRRRSRRSGTVGIIASVSHAFCSACDRTRLTADGQVRNCLFARQETDLRHLHAHPAPTTTRSKRRGAPRCGSRRPGTASTTPASSSRTAR